MKVFITGCTAAHASKHSNEKNASFAGTINAALVELGCEVVWDSPSVRLTKEYLSQFDSVFLGLSSPTNVISHRIYGALSVAKHCLELGNLSIFIDTPDPHKIYAGFREIYKNPESLVKGFYSKKREYNLVLEKNNFENVISGINKLYTETWPKTVIPSYPWTNSSVVSKYIPNIDNSKLFLVSPDSYLLEIQQDRTVPVEGNYWCADNMKTKWSQSVSESLINPVVPFRMSKWEGNKDVLERLSGSIGALISTYKDGNSWWMPTLSQALFVGVPVATDWRHTAHMGPEWAVLPSAIEEMAPDKRLGIAKKQKEYYIQDLPAWAYVKDNLGNILLQKTYA